VLQSINQLKKKRRSRSTSSLPSFSFHLSYSLFNAQSIKQGQSNTRIAVLSKYSSHISDFHPRDIDMTKVELIDPYLCPSDERNPSPSVQLRYCPHDPSG
jgi:hypothetical protein